MQNSPIQLNGTSTVSLIGEILMLAERGSSTLFSSENRAKFEKKYCLSLRHLKCEEHYLSAK
jgi:hypothetical protein